MTIKTSLADAIKNSPCALGINFELLGAKQGFFKGRTYLAWNENTGWKICHLNFFEKFFRFAFGWFKDTHLPKVSVRIELEINVDPYLKNRIETLWKKTYPNKNIQNGSGNPKDVKPTPPAAPPQGNKPEAKPAKPEVNQSGVKPEPAIPPKFKPQPKAEAPNSASTPTPAQNPGSAVPKAPPNVSTKPAPTPKGPTQNAMPKTSIPQPQTKEKLNSAASNKIHSGKKERTNFFEGDPFFDLFFGQGTGFKGGPVPPQQDSNTPGPNFTLPNFNNIFSFFFAQQQGSIPGIPPTIGPSKADRIAELEQKLEEMAGIKITSHEDLKKAYKKWITKNHPDRKPEGKTEKQATDDFQKFTSMIEELKKLKKWD